MNIRLFGIIKKSMVLMIATIMCIGMYTGVYAATNSNSILEQEIKEAYYLEYIKIAKEVSEGTGLDISVLPMNEFKEEDWRTPEEFRSFITEVAQWDLTCTILESIQTYSNVTATKETTVTASGQSRTLAITGNFTTSLNYDTGRQHFSSVESVTSRLKGGTGTWTQTGYEYKSLDGARTCRVTVSGKLKIAGAVFSNKLASAEFYCNSQGVVS